MTVPRKRPLKCPIERFIAVVSGRWKAMVLWRLLAEPQRFSELTSSVAGVTDRALSQALHELAVDGVIERRGEAWALTALGEATRPTLLAAFAWGSLHRDAEQVWSWQSDPDDPVGSDLSHPEAVARVSRLRARTTAPTVDGAIRGDQITAPFARLMADG